MAFLSQRTSCLLLMAWRKDPGGWWNATQMAMGKFGLRDWWYRAHEFCRGQRHETDQNSKAWMALNVTLGETCPTWTNTLLCKMHFMEPS